MRAHVKKRFIDIYNESYEHGIYISLIGACKYLSDIDKNNPIWREKVKMFSGMIREKSTLSILNKGSVKAIQYAKANDNVLNVLKGYISLAENRYKEGDFPVLNKEEIEDFSNYERRIESRYLKKQIKYIRRQLQSLNYSREQV